MNEPTTKSSLSYPLHRLVELMQFINFGRIESPRVQGGQPIFEPAPRIVQKLKMGGDNGPRPEAGLPDFWLKQQTVELLRAIAELGDGEVSVIDRLNFSAIDFFVIAASENPVAAQGRKPFYWVKRHAWIAPGTARVVDAHGFVDLDLAVHCLCRREIYFAERDADIGMDFPRYVNLFGIRENRG